MRYRIYFGLTLLFTVLMVIFSFAFEYYINIGSFSWRIDSIFLLLTLVSFVMGAFQFDLRQVGMEKKHRYKLIFIAICVSMTYFALSNILTRDYDIPVIVAIIGLIILVNLWISYVFMVSFVIKTEDGFIASHRFKPKRTEIRYEDILSIDFNLVFGFIIKTECEKCYVDYTLEGILEFLEEVNERVDEEIYTESFLKLAKLCKSFGVKNSFEILKNMITNEEELSTDKGMES